MVIDTASEPAYELGGGESDVPKTLCTIAAWHMETRARPLLDVTASGKKRHQFCGRRDESSSRLGDDTGITLAASVAMRR